jgi:hypothetical protein
MPFTRGLVFGIQAGWAASTSGYYDDGLTARLADGTYTATVRINEAHRKAFGVPAAHASTKVKVTVRSVADSPAAPEPPVPGPAGLRTRTKVALTPAPRPTGASVARPRGTARLVDRAHPRGRREHRRADPGRQATVPRLLRQRVEPRTVPPGGRRVPTAGT